MGKLWSPTRELLAAITFTNETASGWQEQALAKPILINAATTYTVSVNTVNGLGSIAYYPATSYYFNSPKNFRNLTATLGVYGPAGSFPVLSHTNNGYYRDVVFSPF